MPDHNLLAQAAQATRSGDRPLAGCWRTAVQFGYLAAITLVLLVLLAELATLLQRDLGFNWQAPPPLAVQIHTSQPSPTATQTLPPASPTQTLIATPTPTAPFTATFTPTASATQNRPSPVPTHTASPLPSLTPISGRSTTIGYSVAGRPINVHIFGYGSIQRMIVAGIHGGNEWNTIALADELIAHLHKHPELLPSDVTLFILRSLNPDGEARSKSPDGRVNDHGVDLNRNWDANWLADWPRQGCWSLRPTTSGPYPGSEPETQALMNFLLSHHVSALISYHSAAPSIFPSGDPPDPQSVRFAKAIAAASSYPYPPYETNCLYSGTLVDWAARLGMAAVDLELTDYDHTDFAKNLRVLQVLLTWQP